MLPFFNIFLLVLYYFQIKIMRRNIATTMLVLGICASSNLFAQNLETLKNQKEAVEIQLDLLDKKNDLEKAKIEKQKREEKAVDLNNKANNKGDKFKGAENADKTSDDAKAAAKAFKKAENANKSLERSNDRIIDLEADIKKLESKLDRAKFSVELKEK